MTLLNLFTYIIRIKRKLCLSHALKLVLWFIWLKNRHSTRDLLMFALYVEEKIKPTQKRCDTHTHTHTQATGRHHRLAWIRCVWRVMNRFKWYKFHSMLTFSIHCHRTDMCMRVRMCAVLFSITFICSMYIVPNAIRMATHGLMYIYIFGSHGISYTELMFKLAMSRFIFPIQKRVE